MNRIRHHAPPGAFLLCPHGYIEKFLKKFRKQVSVFRDFGHLIGERLFSGRRGCPTMTTEERVLALHARMDALRRVRERRKTGAIGAASLVLTICLILLVFSGGGLHPGGAVGLYSGATMLFEGAGAYVLIAIIAFMAGVIVTVVLIRNREKEIDQNNPIREEDEEET